MNKENINTVKAILVTGNTYQHRHGLKQCGGIWDKDAKGWIISLSNQYYNEKVIEFCNKSNLEITYVDIPEDKFKPLEKEEIREIRKEKMLKKADQKRSRIATIDKEMAAIDSYIKPYDDMQFWTEPIKIGHHSEKRHRNLRNRLSAKMDKQMELYKEKQELIEGIEHLENTPARVKGDAESKRQAYCDKLDSLVKVGSKLLCQLPGVWNKICTIEKIFKKSYRVLVEDGRTETVEKYFFRLIPNKE